jgi:hypothetical protein
MKITANKIVWWDAGGKQMTGKVRQILSTHALVRAGDSDYLVQKARLSLRPLRTAGEASQCQISTKS